MLPPFIPAATVNPGQTAPNARPNGIGQHKNQGFEPNQEASLREDRRPASRLVD
jgi:hypothetical protein